MQSKLLFIGVWFLSLSIWAQPEWHQISYGGSRSDDIFFLDENHGWVAGSNGYVLKTNDGGENWDVQLSLGDDVYLRNIEFIDANTGFLGTLNNQFYRTIDGGTNWTLIEDLPIPETIEYWGICGMDAVGNTIYACGAYYGPAFLLKSTDAGATWNFIDMEPYADGLVEVLFVDEYVGFASGANQNGGIILKTIDGGVTWSEIYHTGIEGEYVWKLQKLFSNPDVMFGSVQSMAPLNGKLLKTVDNGVSWTSKEVPDPNIQAVGFVTENHGWMGGHGSGFLETFDAGTTWANTMFGSNLNRIQIVNENLAYCSGNGVYKFSDQGLGINDSNENGAREKLEVTIAPNPIANRLDFSIHFKKNDHLILRLYDATGKMLKELMNERITASGKKNYSFPFPYPSGNYYLNLHNDTGRQTETIVKK